MGIHVALWLSIREVFRNIRYVSVALGGGFLAFAFSIWLHNIRLIGDVIASPLFTLPDRALFLLRLLGGITTNTTPLAAVLIVILSVVFGINAALLLYSLRTRQMIIGVRTKTVTAGGILSAIFGVGCASCGTYLLGATLASLGASSLLTFLPLGGLEFLIVSIILLLVSIIWTAKSVATVSVCPISNTYAQR